MCRCFKRVSGVGSDNYIYFWKSKGFSDENITATYTRDYKLNPEFSYYGTKTRVEFIGSLLEFMFRKYFRRLDSRWYENNWIKWLYLWR